MTKSKIQIPMRVWNAFQTRIGISVFCALCLGICHLAFAQDAVKSAALTQQITQAKARSGLYAPFEELKNVYFQDNKYTEFVEFLKSLDRKKNALEPFTNYYAGLARYYQLKYLEETQNWDEYFNNGNAYREELAAVIQKTINATNTQEPLHLYARLILWQFHKDQEDVFAESALSDLMNAAFAYAKETQDTKPLKEAADKLSSYGERDKSKELYKIYVNQLVTSNIKDGELEDVASGFFREGNLDLAELVYDIYIERITSPAAKEKSLPILKDLAKSFSYKCEGIADAAYAEKIFQKIEETSGKDTFDEDLMYLRASNLEKAKEYNQARDVYIDLIQRYPQTVYSDEANFKIGIIYVYISRDLKRGREYFEKLAQKEITSPQVISALYQLGLLSQWEEDFIKAKEYYDKLTDRAGKGFQETVTLTKERLEEIKEAKAIDYNLKMFLDVSLKEEYIMFDATKIELRCCPYRAMKDKNVEISSTPYIIDAGCMQPEIQYLWSGHIGAKKTEQTVPDASGTEVVREEITLTEPALEQSSFPTTYIHSGTKEVNLVVVSATGVIDRNIDMVDAYEQPEQR